MLLKDRYINPFTDFGFKKIFGSEVNKDLLIAFLNTLLPAEAGIVADLSFLPKESLKVYRDLKNVVDTAYDEGMAEGIQQKALDVAKRLKDAGFDIVTISGCTGLAVAVVEGL